MNSYSLKKIFNFQFSFIILLFFLVYYEPILFIITGFFTLNFSHGIFIFLLSLYFIWRKRKLIVETPMKPDLISGVFITLCGCLFLLVGKYSTTLLAQGIALITVICGIILLLFGKAHLKHTVLPIFYLIFAFPFFEQLLGKFSRYFQLYTASISTSIFNLFGFSVFQEGHVIELQHITLDVARECSGINHVIGLMALAVPIAIIFRLTIIRMIFLTIVAFFIGIFANGIRVAAIGFWTFANPRAGVHGPFDLFMLSFVTVIGIAILIALSFFLKKPSKYRTSYLSETRQGESHAKMLTFNGISVLLTILVLGLTAYFIYFFKPAPVYADNVFSDIPYHLDNWTGEDLNSFGESFESAPVDAKMQRIYRDTFGNELKLYIAYFASQTTNKEIFNSRYGYLKTNSAIEHIELPESNIHINRTHYIKNTGNCGAFYFYIVDGELVANIITAKLKLLKRHLLNRKNNGAIIIITKTCTPYDVDNHTISVDFLSSLILSLQHLKSLSAI